MRKALILTGALVALLAASCAKELNNQEPVPNDADKFYASIETSDDTKAFADEKLRVLWDAKDEVSIFNRYTLNERYAFTGNTGDNSGWFEPIKQDVFSVGNELDYIFAVHPFKKSTVISNDGIITLEMPAEQVFRKKSFGLGANTMVSVTKEKKLLFRNACGYLVLSLYGEDVKVSSIMLRGNGDEILAGKADVKMEVDGIPAVKMIPGGKAKVVLTCKDPVALSAKPEEAVEFWFAIPPTVFEKGFSVEITDADGKTFTKSTDKTVEVPRNKKVSMAPIGVKKGNGLGYIAVDLRKVCPLTAALRGFGTSTTQNLTFFDGKDMRVRMSSISCTCQARHDISYHLTQVDLEIPGVSSLSIPLKYVSDDNYESTNKNVASVHLNKYRISTDGTHLDFNLSITLYQETGGDIRIVYSGPVAPALQEDPASAALLPGVFIDSNGRKLRFSKGNLQAVLNNGVITKWQFAEHQWANVEGDISHLSGETGVVDKFVFSTTAPNNRWGTHVDLETYIPGLYNNPDFEEYYKRYMNECQIGSYLPQWKNPDLIAEYGDGWALLDLYSVAMSFDHRENLPRGQYIDYYNARCTPASINGIAGLILFPDGYQQPEGIPMEILKQIMYQSGGAGVYQAYPELSSVQANSYSLEQWEKMEKAGAVFLRNGVYKNDYDTYDDSFFKRDPLISRHYDIKYGSYYIFSDYSGPEWPDIIRLVKYVD